MPEKQIDLSIILPSYLEEENLRLLLPRLNDVLEGLGLVSEILVVDTIAPLDATEQVCAEFGAVYVTRAPGNVFGDAVRTGIQRAQGKWVLFMDADGSHAPEFVKSLWEEAPENDIVIASRYVDGGYTENSAPLRLMSRVLNWTYSLILNLPYKDVSNSFKLYRASLLKSLHLRCDNFDVVEEILYKIVRTHPKLRVKEIPFSFKKRMFGETKRNLVLFIITYLVTMIRLRLSSLD